MRAPPRWSARTLCGREGNRRGPRAARNAQEPERQGMPPHLGL